MTVDRPTKVGRPTQSSGLKEQRSVLGPTFFISLHFAETRLAFEQDAFGSVARVGCLFGRWIVSWVVEGRVGECSAGWLGSCSLFLVLVMMHRDHFFNCTTRCSFGFFTPAAERRSHGCKKPPHPFSLFSEARTLFFNLNFVSHWSSVSP